MWQNTRKGVECHLQLIADGFACIIQDTDLLHPVQQAPCGASTQSTMLALLANSACARVGHMVCLGIHPAKDLEIIAKRDGLNLQAGS